MSLRGVLLYAGGDDAVIYAEAANAAALIASGVAEDVHAVRCLAVEATASVFIERRGQSLPACLERRRRQGAGLTESA